MSRTSRCRSLTSRGIWKLLKGVVPARQTLPLRYSINAIGGLEPELRHLHRLGPNSGVALDIGANEGLYSFRLAQLYDRVHAFEINASITEWLRNYRHPKVEIHDVGLSNRSGSATLYLPIYNGQLLNGWASLAPENCPNAERVIERDVQVRPLDDFQFDNVRFIKADIEGHELSFLQGASQTLRRNVPNVLIEVKEQNRRDVQGFFAELNYEEHRLEDLIGIPGSKENYLYICRNSSAKSPDTAEA